MRYLDQSPIYMLDELSLARNSLTSTISTCGSERDQWRQSRGPLYATATWQIDARESHSASDTGSMTSQRAISASSALPVQVRRLEWRHEAEIISAFGPSADWRLSAPRTQKRSYEALRQGPVSPANGTLRLRIRCKARRRLKFLYPTSASIRSIKPSAFRAILSIPISWPKSPVKSRRTTAWRSSGSSSDSSLLAVL